MADLFEQLAADPAAIVDAPYEADSLSKQLHDVQLARTRKRFNDLRGQVKALDRLATEQGADEIRTACPLVLRS